MVKRPFFWIIALVVAAFVVLPPIGNNVELRESLALAAVYITLASNLNLMLGYAGYINFGSIVFFGLGGYICVWLVDAHGWPLALSLAAAGIGVSALSLIFGFGILRLRGPFFALSTIGIVEGVQAFVENFKPWGGSSGILGYTGGHGASCNPAALSRSCSSRMGAKDCGAAIMGAQGSPSWATRPGTFLIVS